MKIIIGGALMTPLLISMFFLLFALSIGSKEDVFNKKNLIISGIFSVFMACFLWGVIIFLNS